MNGAIYLIVGLLAGAAIGYLFASLQRKTDSTNGALIEDYKKQLEAERNKTENSIKLTAELNAMKETVKELSQQSNEANRTRTEAEARLASTISEMRRASESFFDETKKISGALSKTQTRGKFGEAQLELLLQSAGLREGHEYTRQKSTTDSDSSGIPDITVEMPGGSRIFIDSKFPFDRFVEAFGTEVQSERDEFLAQHTKDLLKHVEALAKRGYHKSQGSPDFVVLFVPFETLLSEALRIDPLFLEKTFKLNVTVATPTSMMALLRTVGYIFTRNKLAQNADDIKNVATTFLKNITLLHGKIVAVGKAISSTAKAYEDLIPTAERTVLSPARRIHNLGVSGDKDKLAIEYPDSPGNVRELRGISDDDDFIEAEEIGDK
ncbi:MAG: DNA recombination protein RmuC [Actinobacteria bacterium]|jgi:DNA recombination protein RmuC|nr:DNA recombination protein RmuC [Actinomycetota bacterium]NDF10889.1 DNA recombination protein RmuC [Actinomycetota bacterium]